MKTSGKKFKVLLCGNKDLLLGRVKKMIEDSEIHFQYSSAPNFLIGRALFNTPDVILLDGDTPWSQLIGVVKELSHQLPRIHVYAIATSVNSQHIVELMNAGAKGFYHFPADYRRFRELINHLIVNWRSTKNRTDFIEFRKESYDFTQIIGKSPLVYEVINRAKKLIENNANTFLIIGETGTGKGLLARAIHYNSRQRELPLVDIACSTLPEPLLESELFGHEKGAFTDAKEKKVGLFELAGDGTIFLDEIGDISLAMQSKLLGVLENRTVRRVGGLKDIPVRARIIAATSADLDTKMKSGEFRKDLYHRLKILPLELPPLRKRVEDIPLLVHSFIAIFNKDYGKSIKGITPGALQILQEQQWDGNIRELRHCIERAVLLEEEECLREADFDMAARSSDSEMDEMLVTSREGPILVLEMPYTKANLHAIEHQVVEKVLTFVSGNKTRAAELLGISRPRLSRILQNHSRI